MKKSVTIYSWCYVHWDIFEFNACLRVRILETILCCNSSLNIFGIKAYKRKLKGHTNGINSGEIVTEIRIEFRNYVLRSA